MQFLNYHIPIPSQRFRVIYGYEFKIYEIKDSIFKLTP